MYKTIRIPIEVEIDVKAEWDDAVWDDVWTEIKSLENGVLGRWTINQEELMSFQTKELDNRFIHDTCAMMAGECVNCKHRLECLVLNGGNNVPTIP